MGVVVLKAEELNLPESIAKKLKGRTVEIVEENQYFIIKPIEDPVAKTFGMFKGGNLTTEKFLDQKKINKELES